MRKGMLALIIVTLTAFVVAIVGSFIIVRAVRHWLEVTAAEYEHPKR
jgi:hypothetical protein